MPSPIRHALFRWTLSVLLACSAQHALADLAVPGAADLVARFNGEGATGGGGLLGKVLGAVGGGGPLAAGDA